MDFDLDLTYVTDRVIAMSYPSSGSETLYRNSIIDVGQFLDKNHFGHYRVYNLCCKGAWLPWHTVLAVRFCFATYHFTL